jgi:hypothetical protein
MVKHNKFSHFMPVERVASAKFQAREMGRPYCVALVMLFLPPEKK